MKGGVEGAGGIIAAGEGLAAKSAVASAALVGTGATLLAAAANSTKELIELEQKKQE